jgi:nucleotidyltransferase substrate binding protein (TIGR01987 family)
MEVPTMDAERFFQRFTDFSRALTRLDEALSVPKSDIVRDAVIQRFEFTFELAWKTMKLWLSGQGVEVHTPAQVLAEALQAGLIIDGNGWSRMQESRNWTSHTYDLALAEAVDAFLRSQGLALFRQLELSLQHQGPR